LINRYSNKEWRIDLYDVHFNSLSNEKVYDNDVVACIGIYSLKDIPKNSFNKILNSDDCFKNPYNINKDKYDNNNDDLNC
jgi:hypothetical protein